MSIKQEATEAATEYMATNRDPKDWLKEARIARKHGGDTGDPYYEQYARILERASGEVVVADIPTGTDEALKSDFEVGRGFGHLIGRLLRFKITRTPKEKKVRKPAGEVIDDAFESASHQASQLPRELWMPILGLLIGLYIGGSIIHDFGTALVLGGILAREGAARANMQTKWLYAWGLLPTFPLIFGSYGYFILAAAIHIFLWQSIPLVTKLPAPNHNRNGNEEEPEEV